MSDDQWAVGDAYERYMGRWSARLAEQVVPAVDGGGGRRWLDVGCGTGALARTVLALAAPGEVVGVDASGGFVAHARERVAHARFEIADARSIPFPDDRFDVVVSGLMINFVPDPERVAAEMARVAVPGAAVAAYVWDYRAMQMIRTFWLAAAELDPGAVDEADRFPLCAPVPLRELWVAVGLADVAVGAIETTSVFADFDDYWTPFLGGQGPAPRGVARAPGGGAGRFDHADGACVAGAGPRNLSYCTRSLFIQTAPGNKPVEETTPGWRIHDRNI